MNPSVQSANVNKFFDIYESLSKKHEKKDKRSVFKKKYVLLSAKQYGMKRLLIGSVFCLSILGKTGVCAATVAVVEQTLLSPQAQISLMTCSPTDDNVYTLYGHSAIRIYDPVTKTDVVYNYGMFDFAQPFFIYRFAKGETDYWVQSYRFERYLLEYIGRGSGVYEQVLNLLPEEKEALFQALVWNERPENRVYRYNFFFDNCATRPVAMIEKYIQGVVKYALPTEYPTFRDIINYCTRNHPWVTFGCDLVLGEPTDRKMTQKESFFLPSTLQKAFNKAEIERGHSTVPLVLKTNTFNEEDALTEPFPSFLTSPIACFSLLLIFLLTITYTEWKRKTHYRWVDIPLFFAAGMGGLVLYFLSFISVHPCIFPNISILWMHPFHLFGVVLFSLKKYNSMAFRYHFINFAAILVMSVAWIFIPQHFNIAFIPLIGSLWLRSGWALLRKKVSYI